jgi:monovalent cation/hydrogen antiporter
LTTFEWTIGLLLGAVVLSGLARQVKVLPPIFLAIGGALLALVPASPSSTLEPKLALALFVAPVLLAAAFDTSLRDLRSNWLPVSTLVVVAVGFTTAVVAGGGAWARSRHAMGGLSRARRHRGASRCGGSDGHPAPDQFAISHAQNPRR